MLLSKQLFNEAMKGNEQARKAYHELSRIQKFGKVINATDFHTKGIVRMLKSQLNGIMLSNNVEFELDMLLNDIYYYGDCSPSSIFVELLAHIKTFIELMNFNLSLYDFPFPFDFLEEVEKLELNNLLFYISI